MPTNPIALPNELLFEILNLLRSDTLSQSPNPLNILLVSSSFYQTYSQLLYGNLVFSRITQITRFIETFRTVSIPQPIRNVTFDVFNDLKLNLYGHIQDFFALCTTARDRACEVDDCGRVVFESLKFRFHTHAMDTSLHMIHEALSWVNPRSFTWVGPDPPHHFSAAIVPAALPHVLRALQTQTNLTRLTLTHVKFPDNGEILSLPRFPFLKTLNLSQVIFLHPDIIAQFVVTAGSQLEHVHLIDAYQHSIWGPRLRRSHIEYAAQKQFVENSSRALGKDDDGIVTVSPSQKEAASNEVLSRIRQIVVCQGKFERIIGGDRVMRDSILI